MPQILPFNFGDDEFNLNDAVSATCTATKGDLPLEIWWSLTETGNINEHKLDANEEIDIRVGKKNSMLSIDSVKARHRGNYTCYAKNKAGIAQFSALLAINGDH